MPTHRKGYTGWFSVPAGRQRVWAWHTTHKARGVVVLALRPVLEQISQSLRKLFGQLFAVQVQRFVTETPGR